MLHNYSWLLFDADNTLFDFDASEAYALQKVVEDLDREYTPEVFRLYHKVNRKAWTAFEKGQLPQDQIQVTRFTGFLKKLKVNADPQEIGDRYLNALATTTFLVPGAKEMLDRLTKTHQLAVITNGLKSVQRKHFAATGLTDYFHTIVVSDEIGVSKPHGEFFDYTFEAIGQPNRKDALIIGDGLSSDIRGGMMYGVDTCWFNNKQLTLKRKYKPTYQIDQLERLFEIGK